MCLEAALDTDAPCEICGASAKLVTPTSSAVIRFNLVATTKIRAVLKGSTSASSGVYARINS